MNNRTDNKLDTNLNSNTNTKTNSLFGNNSMKSLLKKLTKKNVQDIKHLSNIKKESRFIRSNSQPRLISLLDTDLKHRSRGTDFPAQFNRDNYMNLKNFNKTFYGLNNNNIESYKKLQKSNSQSELNTKNNEGDSREKKIRPRLWDNIPKNELVNQKDKLMPQGLEFYEKYMRNTFKQNFFDNNYIFQKQQNGKIKPLLIRKINRIKNCDIDYLSNKNYDNIIIDKECKTNGRNNKQTAEFLESDIFNRKITPAIIKKSGEKQYLKEKLQHSNSENDIHRQKFDVCSETTIGWGVRDPLPSLNNHSSLPYNPLNPRKKNICKTKDDILSDSKKNFKNFNPSNKQKSISEFMFLSRVSAPNINEDYNLAFCKNPNIFKKSENMFSETYKIYHEYESIVDKPFQKFIKSELEDNKTNTNHNNKNDIIVKKM